jgi:hypothetical protein
VGINVEAVEAQKLRWCAGHVAGYLYADTLGGIAAASAAAAHGMGRSSVQIPVLKGECNRASFDSGLAYIHG